MPEPAKGVDELGELINVHLVDVVAFSDVSKGVGVDVATEAAPDALEGGAADAELTAHEGERACLD